MVCSFLFFLALRCFLLPSRKVSRFLLSHIRRYTSVQEGSLDFARDDVTGAALFQHVRCTLHEINPSPRRHFERSREILPALFSFLLLSQKVSRFTLSDIRRYTDVQERSRASLGMTIRGKRLSKHVRCTKRRISIPLLLGYVPHTVISSEVEKSFLHPILSCPFRERFPVSRCRTYGAIPVCKV